MFKQALQAPGQRDSCPGACRHLVRYWLPLDIAAAHAELMGRSCWPVHALQAPSWGCPGATRSTVGGRGEICRKVQTQHEAAKAYMSASSLCSSSRVPRHLVGPDQLLDSNMAALEPSQARQRCLLPRGTASHTCQASAGAAVYPFATAHAQA